MSIRASLLFCSALLVACSSSTTDSTANPGNDSGTATDGNTASIKTAFKTHVILGDSISDQGGQGPFFYDLLDHNDDTKYPEHAGKDFAHVYGSDIKIVKTSKGGAKSINLGGQIAAVPTPLEGPVLVTITIGGNDVTAALGTLLTTGDDSKQIADFTANIDDALKTLTTPDKFGPGVKVTVLMANIYDPSDGTGNFTIGATGAKCPGALGLYPAGKPTQALLDPWEKAMTDTAAKYPGVVVLKMREQFQGHGVEVKSDSWFFGDCIHPNAVGHTNIRDLFFDAAVAQ